MGIKLLSLQMISWCFHLLATTSHHHRHSTTTKKNRITSTSSSSSTTIKLIGADGKVRVYNKPIRAAELMAEHPKHLVCHSDAFFIGQRIPALPPTEELQPGHSYFLLPTHFFQSVLSFVTVASSFATAAAAASGDDTKSSKNRGGGALFRLFDIHKTPSGTLQIRVSDEFIERMCEKEEEVGGGGGGGGRVCTTAALEKDYMQLVECSRGKQRQWKPKLETIREKERRKTRWWVQ